MRGFQFDKEVNVVSDPVDFECGSVQAPNHPAQILVKSFSPWLGDKGAPLIGRKNKVQPKI